MGKFSIEVHDFEVVTIGDNVIIGAGSVVIP